MADPQYVPTEGFRDDPMAFLDAQRDILVSERHTGGTDSIGQWLTDMHAVERTNPDAFRQWTYANPEFGVKYHAKAAAPAMQMNTGLGTEHHAQEAQRLSYLEATNLG